MIVARGNQRGGAGETTFMLRLGGQRARQGRRIALFDADQQRLALHSSEQTTGKRQERLCNVIGLPRSTLRRKASGLSRQADHVILAGLRCVAAFLLPAPVAADLAPVPTRPTRFDSLSSSGVSGRAAEAHAFRPTRTARFVLSRRPARCLIAHGAAQNLADHDPSASASRVGQRVTFAEAARSRQLEQRRTAPQRPSSTRDSGTRRGDRKIGAATAPGAQQRLRCASERRRKPRRPRPIRRRENVGDPARHGRPAGRDRSSAAALQCGQTVGVARVGRSRANSPRAMEAL